jgi:hypothetical protein
MTLYVALTNLTYDASEPGRLANLAEQADGGHPGRTFTKHLP